jgi:outer membrane cobalamin receptor
MPEVFIDGSYYGPIDSLRNIPTTSVDNIEFIGASDATTLYGTGYMGGVIHVHSRTAG